MLKAKLMSQVFYFGFGMIVCLSALGQDKVPCSIKGVRGCEVQPLITIELRQEDPVTSNDSEVISKTFNSSLSANLSNRAPKVTIDQDSDCSFSISLPNGVPSWMEKIADLPDYYSKNREIFHTCDRTSRIWNEIRDQFKRSQMGCLIIGEVFSNGHWQQYRDVVVVSPVYCTR